MTATATAVDFSVVLQPLLQLAGIVLTGLIALYLPRAIAAFEARTGIQFTEQQKATILSGAQAAKGTVETRIDQKIMSVSEVHIDNPEIRYLAHEVIDNAPAAAAAIGATPDSVARSIVGMVDTGSRTPAPPGIVVP